MNESSCKWRLLILLLDPRPYLQNSYKFMLVCLSVRACVRPSKMLVGIHSKRYLFRIKKIDKNNFVNKILFCPKMGKLWQIWAKSGGFFCSFWKIFSFFFLGINLKWKIIWLSLFHCKFLIWQNSASAKVINKNVFGYSDYRIL